MAEPPFWMDHTFWTGAATVLLLGATLWFQVWDRLRNRARLAVEANPAHDMDFGPIVLAFIRNRGGRAVKDVDMEITEVGHDIATGLTWRWNRGSGIVETGKLAAAQSRMSAVPGLAERFATKLELARRGKIAVRVPISLLHSESGGAFLRFSLIADDMRPVTRTFHVSREGTHVVRVGAMRTPWLANINRKRSRRLKVPAGLE